MITVMLVLLFIVAVAALLPARADAFEVAVHDQGAPTAVVTDVAGQLGATTVRIVARPGEPHLEQVRAYQAAGLRVQAAVIVKRWTTPGDIRALLRAWGGQVSTVSVGNEPELNGLHACTYARLYQRAYRLIRREFPGVRVGLREASPFDVVPYTQRMRDCRGVGRVRADFFAIHPYCPDGDPLAPCKTQFRGGYTGIGDLARVTRFLRARGTRRWLSTPRGASLPLRITELSYFAGRGDTAWLWPRAVAQARKHAQQLVVYGLGPVHERSAWPSAALLDRFGAATPSLHALARALGRRLHPARALAPAGDLVTVPPAGEEPQAPVVAHATGVTEDPAPVRPMETPDEGGLSDEPAPVTAPAGSDPAPEGDGSLTPAPEPEPVLAEVGS